MSFSYSFGANPAIDYPRMLIGDTVSANHIFEDSEIEAAYRIQAATWQSSMMYTGSIGRSTLPATPVSYYRVAALLLDSLASNKSRLSGITQLLDVGLSPGTAARSLRDQAKAFREMDDESGAFAIIEQSVGGFLQLYYAQAARSIP